MGEIYPSDGDAGCHANVPAHRLDEFPVGYSSAGCSPAEPASVSPTECQYDLQLSCRSSNLHRTAKNSLSSLSHDRGQAHFVVRFTPDSGIISTISMHAESQAVPLCAAARAAIPVVVVIPAYKPDARLFGLVSELASYGLRSVIVVNDGSPPEYRHLFVKLEDVSGCHVVHHAVNLGKGRALKTAFNYFILHFGDASGLVTADADGQHAPQDILRVARHLSENSNAFTVGTRSFHHDIPFRSYCGNKLTTYMFACLTGKLLSDTQSGLRAIPASLVPSFLGVSGERYEFEMSVLCHVAKNGAAIDEVPIETIYIENNKSSHFHPFHDSMKIYYKLIQFYASSAAASLLDLIIFAIAMHFSGNLFFSFVVGRVLIAAFVNYNINRRYVFQSHADPLRSLLRYYMTFAVFGLISYLAIRALSAGGMSPVLAKVMIETGLSVLSFGIQGIFVFSERKRRS